MKAPSNKFADCEDGNCFSQTGECGIVSHQVSEEKALKRQRTHWKTFRQNVHVLPSGFGFFLSSPVLFFEQNILDAEQGIQNYKFRRALQPAKIVTS